MQSLPSIDLHMHSTFSDGTDTPAQLLKAVKAAGLGCFALTTTPLQAAWSCRASLPPATRSSFRA